MPKVDSSYGWLVAPDPAARSKVDAEIEACYAARDPEPGLPEWPQAFAELETRLLVGRYVSNGQPLFARLPFDYRLVPSPVRAAGLAFLDRLHGGGDCEFPRWPFEGRLDNLRATLWASAAVQAGSILDPVVYPGSRAGAVLLTHDIDSRPETDGVAQLRALERGFGFPAAIGFIPEISWPDQGVVDDLIGDGCDVYCHDVCHDGKLPYGSVDAIRSGFERFFATHAYAQPLVRGFRSGQLLMTSGLLAVLNEWFDYDLSIPDTERGGPYGSVAGCASVHPFLVDGLLEIPLTMPQDFYLANVERYDSQRMLTLWRDKLEAIIAAGGVAVVNTHPVWTSPGRPGIWAAYAGLLEAVERANAWVTTPSQLREWLLLRRKGGVQDEQPPRCGDTSRS